MIKGAPEGWRQTLDKLEAEVGRMQEKAAAGRSSTGPSIWSALMRPRRSRSTKRCRTKAAKNRWFYGPEGWRPIERAMDFRVGGRERAKGGSRAA